MERFVVAIVAGGLALVAGLWIVDVLTAFTTGWIGGVSLMCAGIGGLGWGIWTQLSIERPLARNDA